MPHDYEWIGTLIAFVLPILAFAILLIAIIAVKDALFPERPEVRTLETQKSVPPLLLILRPDIDSKLSPESLEVLISQLADHGRVVIIPTGIPSDFLQVVNGVWRYAE